MLLMLLKMHFKEGANPQKGEKNSLMQTFSTAFSHKHLQRATDVAPRTGV